MQKELEDSASRAQAGPGDQPRRPARATGLPNRRVSRQQAWSKRSTSSWHRARQLLAAAFVAIVGVGVLWRARAAFEAGSAEPPSVIVAEPPLADNMALVAEPPVADNVADVPAQTPVPAESPPLLTVSPLVSPTNIVAPTQALIATRPATLATVPAAAATPDATSSVAPAQASVSSAVPQATTTPVREATDPASAEPEPTALTEEAPPQAESATPTPAPTQAGPAYRTYVVQRGDILKQIAARYGVSMSSILAINTIPNPDSLREGQVLSIPPAGA